MDDFRGLLQNWKFWLIIIFIIIFLLWLFLGGGNYEFIGLNGLSPNTKTSDYIDPNYADYLRTNTPSFYQNKHQNKHQNKQHESNSDICGIESDPYDKYYSDAEITPISTREFEEDPIQEQYLSYDRSEHNYLNSDRSYQQNNYNEKSLSFKSPSLNKTSPSGFYSHLSSSTTPQTHSFIHDVRTNSINRDKHISSTSWRDQGPSPGGYSSEGFFLDVANNRIYRDNKNIIIDQQKYLSTHPTLSMDTTVTLAEALADSINEKKNKAESRGEEICRNSLEKIYNRKFISSRPDFLKNPETGHNLELDGYCEELQIAFEYNGIQHYIYPNWIHKTRQDFEKQIKRDQYKIHACDLAGVYLISIPYTVPHNMIYNYIVYYLPENVQKRIEAEQRGEEVDPPPC